MLQPIALSSFDVKKIIWDASTQNLHLELTSLIPWDLPRFYIDNTKNFNFEFPIFEIDHAILKIDTVIQENVTTDKILGAKT